MNVRVCTVLVVGALATAGGCSEEGQSSSRDPDEGKGTGVLPESADINGLAEVIETLSSERFGGRLTGTDSGDLAERYILDHLEDAGVQTQTQEVTFPLYEVASPASLAVLDSSGETRDELVYLQDFREVDFSGSGAVSGELHFVGYGVDAGDYDSYEGLDVQGRIVAMLTGVPSNEGLDEREDGRLDKKIHTAHEHGATGVIFVLSGRDAQAARQKPLEMELQAKDTQRVLHPELLHEQLPVAFVQLDATERLLGKTAAALARDPVPHATGKRVSLEIHGATHAQATCRNIVGALEGTDAELGHEVIIIGAHYDHLGVDAAGRYFPGAADNATGTSVVLEAARAFAASGLEPKRTIVFAFWCAEEQGLYGSVHYAYEQPAFPLSDTKLMIQVDYLGESDGPYLTNVDDNELVLSFLGDETESEELPIEVANYGGQCASDDCPFLWKGIPAYRFLSFGDHHHVHSDSFEHVNMSIVKRVADVTIRGLASVAY